MAELNNKLIITKKKSLKGGDGYKIFSIRIKEETANVLDVIAFKTERSRNEIVNIVLDYRIKNIEI